MKASWGSSPQVKHPESFFFFLSLACLCPHLTQLLTRSVPVNLNVESGCPNLLKWTAKGPFHHWLCVKSLLCFSNVVLPTWTLHHGDYTGIIACYFSSDSLLVCSYGMRECLTLVCDVIVYATMGVSIWTSAQGSDLLWLHSLWGSLTFWW